jgi:hypothetical protein
MMAIGFPHQLAVTCEAEITVIDGWGISARSFDTVSVIPIPFYRIPHEMVFQIKEGQPMFGRLVRLCEQAPAPFILITLSSASCVGRMGRKTGLDFVTPAFGQGGVNRWVACERHAISVYTVTNEGGTSPQNFRKRHRAYSSNVPGE